METREFQTYKEQAVNTMTQGEQLLLLYDELVKYLTRAELTLKKPDFPAFEAAVEKSTKIVDYLNSILDRQYPISKNLASLYEFMEYELVRVKVGRNQTELERVKSMAIELRDSFRQADKNMQSGKQG
jgi:flagellar protein FliS